MENDATKKRRVRLTGGETRKEVLWELLNKLREACVGGHLISVVGYWSKTGSDLVGEIGKTRR